MGTSKLYAAIAKGEKAQMKINGKLATQTRNARLDIADELRNAKNDFASRMAKLHSNIVRNDKKFEGKMDKLAGIVRSNSVNKINGLVNEYTKVTNAVRARWPMGLGKYLLLKCEQSMLAKGVLQVDKVSNHAGNFVFVNGRAVGLSNKLNDFESLAVRMGHYEATLAKLTAALAGKGRNPAKKYKVAPPEWPGN